MDDRERYIRAAHAMQSGVAFSMPSAETEPKHLRVGLNKRDGGDGRDCAAAYR